MAGLLYVYSRSSIHAAKRNAERHRIADGGQISWYNESQRMHGALERPEVQDPVMQRTADTAYPKKSARRSEEEQMLEARKAQQGR
ncbi:hypothetical protein ACLMJK_007223 [Lecanora helva]